jgi:hypothetical protein
MIGAALALIVVGIVMLFMLPWAGIAVGVVGFVLVTLWLAGFGRRPSRQAQPRS